MIQTPPSKVFRQLGLSMIELMVALAIGVVLLLGLIQIFGSSRAAFATAEGASRVQENARFAMDFLRRDVRMAGHMGCLGERGYLGLAGLPLLMNNHSVNPSTSLAGVPFALRLHLPVEGFEYNGSAPDAAVDLSGGVTLGGGAGAYSPALPAQLGNLAADAVNGSDVLVVRYLSGESVNSVMVNGATNSLLVLDPLDVPFFEAGGVYGVSNCKRVSVFQAQVVGPVVQAGVGGLNAAGWTGAEDGFSSPGSSTRRYEFVVYYVGIDAVSGEPSLKQRRLDPARAQLLSAPQTLVEGVESMQLVYGVDAGATRDDVLDRYVSADGVAALDATLDAAWRRVLNVRVGLLMRSASPAAALRDAGSPPLRIADTVIQVADDSRFRQTYETSMTLRNRVRN